MYLNILLTLFERNKAKTVKNFKLNIYLCSINCTFNNLSKHKPFFFFCSDKDFFISHIIPGKMLCIVCVSIKFSQYICNKIKKCAVSIFIRMSMPTQLIMMKTRSLPVELLLVAERKRRSFRRS